METERREILELLSEGRINVDEAERLLAALGAGKSRPGTGFLCRWESRSRRGDPAGDLG